VPDESQEKTETSSEEPQSGRDYIVFGFLFVIFAGALIILGRWIAPGSGWRLGTAILAASYSASWLFRRFSKRG